MHTTASNVSTASHPSHNYNGADRRHHHHHQIYYQQMESRRCENVSTTAYDSKIKIAVIVKHCQATNGVDGYFLGNFLRVDVNESLENKYKNSK